MFFGGKKIRLIGTLLLVVLAVGFVTTSVFALPKMVIATGPDVIGSARGTDAEEARKAAASQGGIGSDFCWFNPLCWTVTIAGIVFKVIIWILGLLIEGLAKILFAIVGYNGFVQSAAVKQGWSVIRDVSNMFFVVILLAVAIGTILRVESYSFKRLLPKIILMAVLVNFSRLICGLILDVAQVVMLTFVAGFQAIQGEGLLDSLHVHDMLSKAGKLSFSYQSGIDTTVILASGLLTVIMLFIALGTILAMVVFLGARMVMIWILVVLSPLAYILAAFPQGQRYAAQWWQEFTKNVIVGPVLAFFLWLAFTVASTTDGGTTAETFGEDLNLVGESVSTDPTIASKRETLTSIAEPDIMLGFIISIGMLLGGMMIAQQMGAAGGQMAGKAFTFGSRTAPMGIGGWVARKIKAGKIPIVGRFTKGLELNPMNIIRGVGKSFAERKHFDEIEGIAESGAALERGGVTGLIKGLGTGQDWADAYIKGFGNLQGFMAMGRSTLAPYGRFTGTASKQGEILNARDREKARINNLAERIKMRKQALGLSNDDRVKFAMREFTGNNLDARKLDIAAKRVSGTQAEKDQYNYSTDKDEKGKEVKVFIDDAMKARGIDATQSVDDLRAAGRFDEALKKEAFLGEWDEKHAMEGLATEFKGIAEKADKGDALSMGKMTSLSADYFTRTTTKKEEEVKRLEGGGLSDEELEKNSKRLVDINSQMAYLLKQISDNRKAGLFGEADRLQGKYDKLETEGNTIGTFDSAKNLFTIRADAKPVIPTDAKERVAFEEKRKKMINDSKLDLERNKILAKSTDLSAGDRLVAEKEIRDLEIEAKKAKEHFDYFNEKAQHYTPPRAFYASRDRRALENEEMRKITTELDSELIASFRDAVHEGNAVKSTAIFKKVVSDGNDNEILNAYGFTSDSNGMHDFVRAVLMGQKGITTADGKEYSGPSLNMDEQTAFSVENDVAFINESINHWETARLMEVENGRFKQLSEDDHVKGALAEIMKKNTREVTRSFNRLAYGGEKPRADGSGRDFKIAPLGVSILKAMGPEIGENIKRGEYNKNAIMNIGKIIDDLEKLNVDGVYVTQARNNYKKLNDEAGSNVNDIVDDLFTKYGEELRQLRK